MAAITHILDTSAILAHYFDEPGAAEVDAIWQDKKNKTAICALTVPELKMRLHVEVNDRAEVNRAFKLYVDELTTIVPVDRAVADEAAALRESAPSRLPLVDACIAGCAKQHRCVLVHRDPHLAQLPGSVQQLHLPDKA